MIKISTGANPNYLAKVVKLQNVQKHPNADKLQIVNIDFQTVITGLDAQDGMFYVYFPLESQLNVEFLSQTNSFRHKELNADQTQVGFFEDNARVRAVRLRGTPSQGYIVPIKIVEDFANVSGLSSYVGQEFDTINDILLLKKYQVKEKTSGLSNKQGKKPKLSRLIEGQVHLHIDTENLRKNVYQINPDDEISITYKTHGTSWWVGNVIVKRTLNWKERLAKFFGVKVQETEYDHIYGSRRVVKNSDVADPKAKDHFYGYDVWEDIKNTVKDFIPKGYTLYGEAIGYDKNGGAIQKGYDYKCANGEMKLEVYRITHTTPDGLVTELNYSQIQEFCERSGLTASYKFYTGKAIDWLNLRFLNGREELNDFHETFLRELEKEYNEKDCFMCSNSVPEEGIVLRKEKLFSCESFKLKSFRFLEWETKELDAGESDIESDN